MHCNLTRSGDTSADGQAKDGYIFLDFASDELPLKFKVAFDAAKVFCVKTREVGGGGLTDEFTLVSSLPCELAKWMCEQRCRRGVVEWREEASPRCCAYTEVTLMSVDGKGQPVFCDVQGREGPCQRQDRRFTFRSDDVGVRLIANRELVTKALLFVTVPCVPFGDKVLKVIASHGNVESPCVMTTSRR